MKRGDGRIPPASALHLCCSNYERRISPGCKLPMSCHGWPSSPLREPQRLRVARPFSSAASGSDRSAVALRVYPCLWMRPLSCIQGLSADLLDKASYSLPFLLIRFVARLAERNVVGFDRVPAADTAIGSPEQISFAVHAITRPHS